MTENFVLVHGAWHGGWAWQPVASRLRAAGHGVWAPTCPGLGIDDDPRGVTLAGCVDSLVSQVEASCAVDITLVGHSWGGYAIAGAAPRLVSRLKALVFWSAFVPRPGCSLDERGPAAVPGAVQPAGRGVRGQHRRAAAGGVPGRFHGRRRPRRGRRWCTRCCARSPTGRSPTRPPTRPTAAWAFPLHYVLSAGDVALPPGEYGWDRFAERIKVLSVVIRPWRSALGRCRFAPHDLGQPH